MLLHSLRTYVALTADICPNSLFHSGMLRVRPLWAWLRKERCQHPSPHSRRTTHMTLTTTKLLTPTTLTVTHRHRVAIPVGGATAAGSGVGISRTRIFSSLKQRRVYERCHLLRVAQAPFHSHVASNTTREVHHMRRDVPLAVYIFVVLKLRFTTLRGDIFRSDALSYTLSCVPSVTAFDKMLHFCSKFSSLMHARRCVYKRTRACDNKHESVFLFVLRTHVRFFHMLACLHVRCDCPVREVRAACALPHRHMPTCQTHTARQVREDRDC